MASKINTRFVVIIIAAAVVGAGVIMGGLMVLQWRGDATRNIRQGDAALAAGNLKSARDLYGRAVHKQPGNVEYLQKLESVILQMTPQTTEEAAQLYRDRVGILQHRAKHRPTDPEAHLALLREVHGSAKLSGLNFWWEYVSTAADDMLDRVPEDDPKHNYAKIYKGMATLQQSALKELDELDAAIGELKELVKEYPDDDLAWAALIMGYRNVADKMRISSKPDEMIKAKWDELDQTADAAIKAVPKGVEVARANFWRLAARRSGEPENVPAAKVKAAGEHLASLLNEDTSTVVMTEATDLMAAVREKDQYDFMKVAIGILEKYLAKHSNAIDKRLSMGTWLYLTGEMDKAAEQANVIMASPLVPVSLLAQLQFEIRKRAASLLVDVEQRRWAMETDESKKPERMAAIDAARDRLAAMVSNPANDLLVLRADGRIAQGKGDFVRAVACFERVIKESPIPDIEMLLFAADGLARINEIGLAHERLSQALQYQPKNWGLVVEKAKMEVRMGRMDEAKQTLATLPPEESATDEVKALARAAETTLTEAPTAVSNPESTAITTALTMLNRGEADNARNTLLAALESAPNHVGIIQTLVGVEFRDGKVDKAKEYLDRAIKLQPENPMFKQWDLALKYEDPIEALTKYEESIGRDEGSRAVVMALSLGAMRMQQEAIAKRAEATDPALADKARALAARAKDGHASWLAIAKEKAPYNPDLIEFEFKKALMDSNWAAAEEVVSRVRAKNMDQVEGNLYKGRLEIVRGNLQEAVQILESVTDKLSYSSAAWKTLATAYQTLGNWGQAQRAFEQAYKCNPNDVDAAWAYVSVLVYKGDKIRALGVMQTMRKLLPRDPRIREAWLQLESEAGDRQMAFNERKRWYLAEPTAVENAKNYAKLLCETTPDWETITDDNLRPLVNEQRWGRLAVEERQALVDKHHAEWQTRSNEILDRLSANAKDDIQLAILKARLHRMRNQVMEGEKVLRDFIESHKPNLTAEMLIELGKYQVDSNHFNEGIANFEDAKNYQDPKTRDANMALGTMYLSLNMFDEALPELLKVEETNPNNRLQQNIVECLIRLKRFDEARKRLDDMIAKHSSTAVTTMLEAALLEGQADALLAANDTIGAERKYAEQRELLAKAESQDVTNPVPQILLAQTYYNQFNRTQQLTLLDDALLALSRADSRKPNDMQTQMMRVDVLRAKGDLQAAIQELRRVLKEQPDAPVARRQILQLYLDTGDRNSAFETVKEAIQINPTLAFWWETLGDLYLNIDMNAAEAYQAYSKAYERVPNPKMLSKLLEAALKLTPPDYAGIVALVDKNKAHLDTTPTLRLVYARALNGHGQRDAGLEQMKIGYAQYKKHLTDNKLDGSGINDWYGCIRWFFDPSKETAKIEEFVTQLNPSLDVHELRILSRMWTASGPEGTSRGVELQNKAIERCPANDPKLKASLYKDLGNYYLTAKQFELGAQAYEKAVQADPDNVDALNNLSYVLADELHQPERALPHAEQAARLRPRDANILDTAGWVNFLVGNNDKAKKFLQQSLIEFEDNPPAQYHMGCVLEKDGNLEEAEKHLKKALELKPDGKTKQQIEELLKKIENAK